MKKPIFRVFASYIIKNKKRITRRIVKGTVDTFVLTDDIEMIKKDKELINRICYINRKLPSDVEVIIENIEVENQYGETADRF